MRNCGPAKLDHKSQCVTNVAGTKSFISTAEVDLKVLFNKKAIGLQLPAMQVKVKYPVMFECYVQLNSQQPTSQRLKLCSVMCVPPILPQVNIFKLAKTKAKVVLDYAWKVCALCKCCE